jgi:hypothetical protein
LLLLPQLVRIIFILLLLQAHKQQWLLLNGPVAAAELSGRLYPFVPALPIVWLLNLK